MDHQDPDLGLVPVTSRRDEFPLAETHGIALWPKHRLLADSRGLGWHDAYVSLATESPWTKTLDAVPHLCFAYCRSRAASVTRTMPDEHRLDRIELRPRMFGVIPADRTSSWKLVGAPDIELVYLRRPMVDRVAREVYGLDPAQVEIVPRLGFADGMLEQLVIALLDAARRDDGAADGLYADHVVRMLAVHVLRHHATRASSGTAATRSDVPRRADRIDRVRDLIEHALADDLSLERLAAEAGIGAHGFSVAFRRAVGMSPHRYVVQRRVERAKRLLREGDLPIAEVAVRTGFASQSHLAVTFKREVGATPGEYQRRRGGVGG